MRGISEIVSMMVLLVAVAVAFITVLVVVPKYFATYNAVAMKASFSQTLEGFQTASSLSRYKSQYLVVLIYNYGSTPIRVNYYVECINPNNTAIRCFAGKKEGVLISPSSTYQMVLSNSCRSDMVCYLVVEEPNLLIYKVLES